MTVITSSLSFCQNLKKEIKLPSELSKNLTASLLQTAVNVHLSAGIELKLTRRADLGYCPAKIITSRTGQRDLGISGCRGDQRQTRVRVFSSTSAETRA